MSLLAPGALLLAALAIPILVLYMLKLRRREVQVSSTFLWQRLLRDRQANAPWQRLKRNLLLFLQLLILAALVLALARPALKVPSVASGSVVVLLDASASMNAIDGSTGEKPVSRFEAAQTVVRTLIDALPGGSRMTLIEVTHQPRSLVSTENDKAELRQALDAAQPSQESPDWEAAFALAAGAAGAAGSASSSSSTVVLISDGGLPEGMPPLPGEVRYVPVGESSDNLAVSALAARPAGDHTELFASITNYSNRSQDAILSIYSDGSLLMSQQLSLPAGESRDVIQKNLPNRPARYEARISAPAQEDSGRTLDVLPLDDAAYTMFQPPQSGRTLLVSKSNVFLEQLLASLPGLQPFRVVPGEDDNLDLPNEVFDLYVLDGVLPEPLPASNLLLINPSAGGELFQVTGVFTGTANAVISDSSLTRFVDWKSVHVRQARQVSLPDWANILIQSDDGPLVFAGTQGGRRVAVVTFDLHDSDLPLQISFPILFANLISFLLQSPAVTATGAVDDVQDGVHPGESITLQMEADTSGQPAVVTSPSQKAFTLQPGENGYIFSNTGEQGFYTFRSTGTDVAAQVFAVNLFAPLESNIRPAATVQLGRSTITASGRQEAGQRELWPWLAGLALAVLLIEWWVYQRRQTISPAWLAALPFRLRRGSR